MSVSFHVVEQGLSHQFKMPDVPKPDALPTEAELKERVWPLMPEAVRRYYKRERPIEIRPLEYGRYLGEKSEAVSYTHLDVYKRQGRHRRSSAPSRCRRPVSPPRPSE